MAGAAGIEPANHGIKTRCLTTWLRPNIKELFHDFCAMPVSAHTSLGGLPLICKARRADNLVLALPNLARKPCNVKLNKGPTFQP